MYTIHRISCGNRWVSSPYTGDYLIICGGKKSYECVYHGVAFLKEIIRQNPVGSKDFFIRDKNGKVVYKNDKNLKIPE